MTHPQVITVIHITLTSTVTYTTFTLSGDHCDGMRDRHHLGQSRLRGCFGQRKHCPLGKQRPRKHATPTSGPSSDATAWRRRIASDCGAKTYCLTSPVRSGSETTLNKNVYFSFLFALLHLKDCLDRQRKDVQCNASQRNATGKGTQS
jgi:hypothetical protein